MTKGQVFIPQVQVLFTEQETFCFVLCYKLVWVGKVIALFYMLIFVVLHFVCVCTAHTDQRTS